MMSYRKSVICCLCVSNSTAASPLVGIMALKNSPDAKMEFKLPYIMSN